MTTGRLRKNITALFVLQGANYVLPLIVVPYLVRVLGPENFGRMAFAQAFIQYFVIFTDYGFNLSATRAVAQIRDDKEALSRLASAVMFVKICFMSIGFFIMLGIVFFIPEWRADWELYALMYMIVVGSVIFPVWLLQGLEKMRYITILSIISRIVTTIFIFVLVMEESDYHLAAALQASSMAIAGLALFFVLPRIVSLRWQWPDFSDICNVVHAGWHVFIASFAGNVVNSSNVFFLGIVNTPGDVGYFSAAEKLIRAVQSLIYPVSQAVYPYTSSLLKQSYEKALKFVSKVAKIFSLCAFATSSILFIFANLIVSILYGDGFQISADLVKILSIIPFLIAINNILGAQVLVQFGFMKILSVSTIIPMVIHIFLLYFVSMKFGVIGVSFLMIFSETLMLLIRIFGLSVHHHSLLKTIFFR